MLRHFSDKSLAARQPDELNAAPPAHWTCLEPFIRRVPPMGGTEFDAARSPLDIGRSQKVMAAMAAPANRSIAILYPSGIHLFFPGPGPQLYIKTIGPPTMAHGPGKQDFITVSYSNMISSTRIVYKYDLYLIS